MNDPEIEQRFHLMQKELEANGTLLKDAKAEMAAAIDARKIENEIMDRRTRFELLPTTLPQ
jgi:hypothetical protein